MELKLSSYSILLVDAEIVEKDVKNLDYFDDVVNKCIDYESRSRILAIVTHSQNASVIKLKKRFKDIWSGNS